MDETTFQAAAFAADGTPRDRATLPATLFDGTVNMPVMHQAVKAFLANQRQGNASTKTRGLVTGGNQKPWKQKGTGRARQGSTRAPHWVGGGTVFGPTNDRNYEQKVPRKVRQLGLAMALADRQETGKLLAVDGFDLDGKTKGFLKWASDNGLRGAMMWDLSGDTPDNSLLNAINSNL